MSWERMLRNILIGGVFLLPLMPFIVANSMFFPFITGKNFFFRILVEILFGGWVVLAVKDPRYRPSFSWILVAILAFVAVIGAADLFGENPFKSFWSNFERMEGWMTLLHLLAYFLVAGSVLTTTKLWGWLAHVSVGASVIVGLYGLGQLAGKLEIHQSDVRLDATLGNSAYLAIYLVFHAFITLLLMVKWRGAPWVRYLYLAPLALQLLILYHTATRGAILGFLGGVLLSALLIALFERERLGMRRLAVASLVVVVVAVGSFFVLKDAAFVKKSPVLSRFSSISLTEPTVLSRFTIWGMALEGAKEHPILGWGQENFNLVFNKYYRPVLYDHEPWFDRVHDIVLDWLIAGGILGLVAYLFVPLAFLYHLWRPKSRVHFSRTEQGLLTGLVAAYFFHNIFVFDNIISYVLFFSVLAYVHALTSRPADETSVWARSFGEGASRVAMVFIVIATVGAMYFANWSGIATSYALIQGLTSANTPAERIAAFERAASYDALGRQEVAEQSMQIAVEFMRQGAPLEVRQQMVTLAEREMLEELERAPDDARLNVFLASLYDQYGQHEQAREYFDRALVYSPEKQRIWYQLAFNRLNLKMYDEALALFKRAYELEPNSDESAIYYAIGSLYVGDVARADELLDKVRETVLVGNNLLLNTYAELGFYDRLAAIWEARIKRDPNNPQLHLSLAATYLQGGRRDDAIAEIERAIVLNPAFKEQGERLIEEIRAGGNPVESAN